MNMLEDQAEKILLGSVNKGLFRSDTVAQIFHRSFNTLAR